MKSLFAQVFENNPIAIEIYSAEGQFLKANKKFLETFLPREKVHTIAITLFDALGLSKAEWAEINQGKTVRFDLEADHATAAIKAAYVSAKSPWKQLHLTIHTLMDTHPGDVAGYALYLEPAYDLIPIPGTLLRPEERVLKSMDSLMEGCQIIGFDWRFLYINDAAANQGRKPKSDFLGFTMMQVLPGIENTEMFSLLRRVMETRIPENMENEFTYFDGLKGWFELRVQPSEEGIFILSLDITTRKRAEEALARSEAELRKAQRLESIGLLAGGIAHDFNNLMGGIFGYLDLARHETNREISSAYLTKAVETIERARGLTQNLLTFSRGGAPIKKVLPLYPLIEDTAQAALVGSKVSCQFTKDDYLWSCHIDKVQIAQVIDNIVINAMQAMPEGGRIELATHNKTLKNKEHPRLSAGNYVEISIKDSGVGIAKEILQKIFDPFFTTKSMGHGLGLATCYSIVVRHGGSIDVESEPGIMTVFKIYLPAAI